MSVRELVQQDVYARIHISLAEINRRYAQVKNSRVPADVPRAAVNEQIRNELWHQKGQKAVEDYVKKLRERYGTAFHSPPSERIAIDGNSHGGPERGLPDAPVTLVEFSDLE